MWIDKHIYLLYDNSFEKFSKSSVFKYSKLVITITPQIQYLDILTRINSWDSGINKDRTSHDGLMSSTPMDDAPPIFIDLC